MGRTALAAHTPLLLLLGLSLGVGCAQLLGWDELQVGASDATTDAPSEGAVDTGAADAEAGVSSARWPDRPPGATTSGGGKTLWWVAKRIYFGTLNHDGAATPEAWREWGYDLDGRCTGTADLSGPTTCKAVSDPSVLLDGDLCRDNNFGARFLGLLVAGTKSSFESDTVTSLLGGSATWVLKLEDVGEGDDDPYVPGAFYVTTSTDTPPKFDGTETRDILADSVIGGDLGTPVTRFEKGYLRGGTWVSGELGPATLRIPFGGKGSAPLGFSAMVMTTRLSTDRTKAGGGVLAGVMSVPAFEAFLSPIAADAKICPGEPLYKSIVGAIARYPDLSLGAPSLQDPTRTCDGVSMGLGFELAPILPPTRVVALPPPASNCGDAGTD
ncbi:MAG: hypothetical protein JNL79_11750 [Myxococcales bacterium]|nr:hypothetical protein [Myxococcales bacterium]